MASCKGSVMREDNPCPLADEYLMSFCATDTLKHKKMAFDLGQPLTTVDKFFCQTSLQSTSDCNRVLKSFSGPIFKSNKDYKYLCDWFPQMFGIDEEFMPSSEDEEGLFSALEDNEELEERANALTPSELNYLRGGSREHYTDDDLRAKWKRDHIPRYGRRARQKPILHRENNEEFECICDIHRSYSRHHISHFNGGIKREGEEWRTPHFIAFWENYHDKSRPDEKAELAKLFDAHPEEEADKEKAAYFRPIPKFPGLGKKGIKNYREQLLASFRPLTCREIRRYRMPYAEALYLELQEDDYLETASLFKEILLKDHYLHQNPQTDGPLLRRSKAKMNKLVAFLKIAEKFSHKKEYHEEALILLRSGKYFNDHDKSWWWLAEAFYTQAVQVSQKSVIDGGKSEAIARFIFGIFLLDCVHSVQEAQEHLSKAREMSLGKDWNAGRIFNKTQDPVYKECANYLCRALIAASKELRKNGKPEEALPLIHRSHKLCREAGNPKREVEMETYFELGITYQEVGLLKWAKVAFRKFIEIAKLIGNAKKICDGYLELAISFRREGDLVRCHHNLLNYLQTAEMHEDVNLSAYGQRYLGEYHLNNGNAKIAADFFRNAFESFLAQCFDCFHTPYEQWSEEDYHLPQDVELARALVGLAEGEMLTKPICYLILQARDTRNQKETSKLILWKNRRELQVDEEETKSEEPVFVVEPDNTQIQPPREVKEESEETLGEVTDFRTVRFALDEKKSAILL